MDLSFRIIRPLVTHGEEIEAVRPLTLTRIGSLKPGATRLARIFGQGIGPACARTTVVALFGEPHPGLADVSAEVALFGLRYGDGVYRARLSFCPGEPGYQTCSLSPIDRIGAEVSRALSLRWQEPSAFEGE